MPVPITLKFKYRDTEFNYKGQKSPSGNSGRNKKKKVVDKRTLSPQVPKILWLQANGKKRFVTPEQLEQFQAKNKADS